MDNFTASATMDREDVAGDGPWGGTVQIGTSLFTYHATDAQVYVTAPDGTIRDTKWPAGISSVCAAALNVTLYLFGDVY